MDALNPPNGSDPWANFAGLWAPNTYKFLKSAPGAQDLCSGASVYKKIMGGIMVREEFAQLYPDRVTRALTGWLRGIAFMMNPQNKEELLSYMDAFYSLNGVNLTKDDFESDIASIGLLGLDEQLGEMTRSGTPPQSNYDFWTLDVSRFLLDTGGVERYPEPSEYITDKFLQAIKNNPQLTAFARGEEGVNLCFGEGCSSPTSSAPRPYCMNLLLFLVSVLWLSLP